LAILYEMSFLTQLKQLRARRNIPTAGLAELVGIARPNLVTTLSGKHDTRGSTLEALASALDAQWVLVPKERLEAVQRVLEGRDTGPDREAKSAVQLFLEKDK
jgi:hypothetical protein